jgi:hypothetical protein
MDCEHWEKRDAKQELGYVPSAAIGYCPLFNKFTEAAHGIHCTAYSTKTPRSDFLTHYAAHCAPAWLAIHVPSAKRVLVGSDADFCDIGNLMAGYCNVLECAGLLHYGETEADAIERAAKAGPDCALPNGLALSADEFSHGLTWWHGLTRTERLTVLAEAARVRGWDGQDLTKASAPADAWALWKAGKIRMDGTVPNGSHEPRGEQAPK